jgi:hypothetical protein
MTGVMGVVLKLRRAADALEDLATMGAAPLLKNRNMAALVTTALRGNPVPVRRKRSKGRLYYRAGMHWTQRPENREKVQRNLAMANRARGLEG